jgi:hypothetical protein
MTRDSGILYIEFENKTSNQSFDHASDHSQGSSTNSYETIKQCEYIRRQTLFDQSQNPGVLRLQVSWSPESSV